MEDKCGWKEDIFTGCSEFGNGFDVSRYRGGVDIICKHCQGLLNRLPDEPVIKKSGETWVMRKKGLDYLFLAFNGEIEPHPDNEGWKLFSDIILTNEIAKKNPRIISNCYPGTSILLAMSKDEIFIVNEINKDGSWDSRTTEPLHSFERFATINDILDENILFYPSKGDAHG